VGTSEIKGERGERVVYLGDEGEGPSVSLRARQSFERDAPYDRYDLGIHHLAFAAPSREVVDERARWIGEQDVTIESGPAEYDYTQDYYAVFFDDPDGLKLEIVHRS
jgi:glyoxylase I family protein